MDMTDREMALAQFLLVAGTLLAMAFVMVTCVLYTLASRMNRELRVHKLLLETHSLRRDYLRKRQQD